MPPTWRPAFPSVSQPRSPADAASRRRSRRPDRCCPLDSHCRRVYERRAAGRAHPLPTPCGSGTPHRKGPPMTPNSAWACASLVDGAVGFAATVDVTPAEAANLVRIATETARVTAQAGGGRVAAGARTLARRGHVDECVRHRSGHGAPGGQGGAARGAQPPIAGGRRGLPCHGRSAQRRRGDVFGRLERARATQRRGASSPADGGARPRRRRLRDHAHAGSARRAWMGVRDGRRRMGLGRRVGPHARIPRREAARPFGRRRAHTTSWSIPPICG